MVALDQANSHSDLWKFMLFDLKFYQWSAAAANTSSARCGVHTQAVCDIAAYYPEYHSKYAFPAHQDKHMGVDSDWLHVQAAVAPLSSALWRVVLFKYCGSKTRKHNRCESQCQM